MKQTCKICGHGCHCYGKGYNVSTNKCESCICDACTHVIKLEKIEKTEKKSWWQKYVDWLFN